MANACTVPPALPTSSVSPDAATPDSVTPLTAPLTWKVPAWRPEAASGDTLLVGSAGGTVHAFATGGAGVSWTSPAAGAAIASAPTSGGNIVYAGSRDHYVYAFDLETGQRKWRTNVGGTARPAQPTETQLLWVGSQDGTMYVLSADTGKIVGRVAVGGPVGAAPLTVIGQVYLGTTKGALYDVYEDLTNAPSVMWRFTANGAITGTPVPVGNGGTAFTATTLGTVYAVTPGSDISSQPGTALWHVQLGGPVRSGLAFHGNTLYAGCDDGYLYAIDTTDNTVSWKYRAGAAIRSQILVTGGLIYFGTLDHHVHAVKED